MRNGNQAAFAVGAAGVVVLIAALMIYAPSLLSFVVPVAVFVFLGIYGRRKQQQLERQRQAAAAEFASPPAPQVQHVHQPQQDQPVRQGLQGPVPPNPWWQSQAFPTSQPPPAPPVPTTPPPPPARAADPGQITVPPELHARVEELRKTGKTVEAIDLLREETGMELYPASRYVLAIEAP